MKFFQYKAKRDDTGYSAKPKNKIGLFDATNKSMYQNFD